MDTLSNILRFLSTYIQNIVIVTKAYLTLGYGRFSLFLSRLSTFYNVSRVGE